jgi:type IV secretory pathway VirB10-like protein
MSQADAEAAPEPEDVFEEGEASQPAAPPSPSPAPVGPTTLNVGSQFDMVLDLPVLTGAATTPVAAHLVDDVSVGERVVIPAGSRIVGEAFSTMEDDRAQIVLTAVVVNGKTIPLQGLALGKDSAFGVVGKVVRKGSAPKAGFGKVLGSVGRALSFGLIGSGSSSTLAGAAAYGVESAAGGELQGLDQRWRRSNKIIRVEPGTRARVYLRSDLVV